MKHFRLLACAGLLSFLLFPVHTTAQSQTADWGAMYGIAFTKKVTSKLSLSLEGEYRTRNHLRSTERFETTLDASYKLMSFLKVGAAYTLINYDSPTNKYRDWEVRHRWSAYLTASHQVGRLKISLREKYQQTYRMGVPASENDSSYNVETESWDQSIKERANPKKVLRSRLAFSYNIRKCKFEPYASIELSHLLNDPYDNGLSRVRYTVGTEYKLNKKNVVSVYYRFNNEKEKNRKGDEEEPNSHYVGVGFTHKF